MGDSRGGPLAGIKVLDLSAYIAGPYGCTLLADLGAEVVKVEPPTGDTLRQYPSTLRQESRAFLGCNRSKLGISLDLKQAEGLQVLLKLVETADVFVHNFRPSVPGRLGIAYEQLKELNPRLIYGAVTGYGETGPLKDKAGYDQVLQSMTGICVLQGDAENPEIVYGSPVDYYAASMLAYGVTAALYHRQRTGEGRLYISANTPHCWSSLCELIGLPDLANDSNYNTVRKRADRAVELIPKLRQALLARNAKEWEELFGEKVPCCAVRSIEEMFDHPQVLAEGLVTSVEHPKVGRYRGMTQPVKLSASPGPPSFAAPAFGQHTEEVLARAGYSEEEIGRLRETGVIPNQP